ncbi:MAG: aldehyde dehydrogenase family protein, partial [Solirubrobacteraceae bacterium]
MATMIIDGERVEASSGRTYEIRDPATGDVVDRVPDGGPEDLDRAAVAAARAQQDWGRRSAIERREILQKAAAHMLTRVPEIAELLTREQGKTLLESRLEAERFGENIAWYADLADKVHGQQVGLPPQTRA